MGLLSKITKGGLAKKAIDEASKPHNKRKIKQALSSVTNRGKGSGTTGGTTGRR
ncbi:hypothetical protein [Modestobacter lapidis]|nr:hypothetical protein [Modestobacter lapidis]